MRPRFGRRAALGRRAVSQFPPAIAALQGWKLTLAEEWTNQTGVWNTNPKTANNPTAVANGRWSTVIPTGSGDRTLSSNEEIQWYADPSYPENPFQFINNGLRIKAFPASATYKGTQYNPNSYNYISGTLATAGINEQKYGYWEMRAKLPKGRGFWPSMWLYCSTHYWFNTDFEWPPEIDVFECHGDRPGETHWGIHWIDNPANNGGQWNHQGDGNWYTAGTDLTATFNTWGLLWQADKIVYYFNDVPYKTISPIPEQLTGVKMFLIIQLAMGGAWANAPDAETQFPGNFDIDYIRIYSNDPTVSGISLPARAKPAALATPARPASKGAPVATTAYTGTGIAVGTSGTTTGTSGNDLMNIASGGGYQVYAAGGVGDDTYYVTNPNNTRIMENVGEGTDLVQTWANFPLAANAENLQNVANYGLLLYGNTQSNFIDGGNSTDDTIAGGGGDDVITLHGGNNLIVVTAGRQYTLTLNDFKPGVTTPRDRMLLVGYGYASPAVVISHMAQSGSNVVLTMDNGETILFKNVTVAAFNVGNFRVAEVSSAGGGVADNGFVDGPIPPVYTAAAAAHSAAPVDSAYVNPNFISYNAAGETGTAGTDVFPYNAGEPQTGLGGDDFYGSNAGGSEANIVEAPGGGNDWIEVWAGSVTMPPNVENAGSTQSGYNVAFTGNDTPNAFVGGSGSDTMYGGKGDDRMTGGGGANTFRVKAGEGFDTITDFKAGSGTPHDTLILDSYGYASPAVVLTHLTQAGSNVVLTLDNGETVTFQNTTLANFVAANFQVVNVTAGSGP